MAALLAFEQILGERNVPLRESRLLRHDGRGRDEWRRGKAAFGHFASYQSRRPYNRCRYAFQFIPDRPLEDGRQTGLLVGATEILDRWEYDGVRCARMSTDEALRATPYRPELGEEAYDLVWLDSFEDLAERLVIEWGNPRAWSQWANQPKEVVEFRRCAEEPPFPGFGKMVTSFEDIPMLWRSWREALGSVGGVYLLVDPEEGDQYVGSAYGEGGFMGRFDEYAANGHGGNKLLRSRGRANYSVSILEVASSEMSVSDIIGRESVWKRKLGSRAHGLNAN
ncbi:MAG: GIY-YIG nuclease family protein [Gammaproteobacteria bacterium]|nr:GIY-YIG nuclease family protein [Gammaproteobacteria bacterium]